MVHAKIKIEIIVGTTVRKTMFYDIRDCQYYTDCESGTGDVTVRYDYGNNKLWFIENVVTSGVATSENGWDEISNNETKTFWEVHGYEHCSITQPQRPTGLTVVASGTHPRLDWNANTESDLAGYKVFKKDGTTYFSQIATTTNNYYSDGSETIGLGQPQMYVQYFVKAYNTSSENSFPSNEVQIKVWDNNAQKIGINNSESVSKIKYKLGQNYPNPFNPSTKITYSLKDKSFVFLAIYNSNGEHIQTLVNEVKQSGNHAVNFDGSNLTNGVYYYKIITNELIDTKKMILLK